MFKVGLRLTRGDEEYVVTEELKNGGFGHVFRARRTKPEELEVAIKVPKKYVLESEKWRRKFEREARILANIDHPNVVKILAFLKIRDSNEMALVQEFVEGAKSLSEYVRDSPEATASVFLQSLYALRAFHDGGKRTSVIHRDLSPNNILVDREGVVKVIDFGLAKEAPRLTEILTDTGDRFGTVGCIAPEQMDADSEVDHRADLFGLGKAFAAAIQQRLPQYAEVSKLDEPWRSLCQRLVEHRPEDRFSSAEAALEHALSEISRYSGALEPFSIHLAEPVAARGEEAWARLCCKHFTSRQDLDMRDVGQLAQLPSSVFSSGFSVGAFFEELEKSSAILAFDSGECQFEDCDPFGELYANLYSLLDRRRKIVCFKRLCSTAVTWHRFSLMGKVRGILKRETDQSLQSELKTILKVEDPNDIVWVP